MYESHVHGIQTENYLCQLFSSSVFVYYQAEENKDEHMDEMLKKIKEHEAYVSKVGFTGSLAFICSIAPEKISGIELCLVNRISGLL